MRYTINLPFLELVNFLAEKYRGDSANEGLNSASVMLFLNDGVFKVGLTSGSFTRHGDLLLEWKITSLVKWAICQSFDFCLRFFSLSKGVFRKIKAALSIGNSMRDSARLP